jgi:hypothetical protein
VKGVCGGIASLAHTPTHLARFLVGDERGNLRIDVGEGAVILEELALLGARLCVACFVCV